MVRYLGLWCCKYEAKQNRCFKSGVLPAGGIFWTFYSENYLDIQENPSVRILKVRKSFKEVKQRDVFFKAQSNVNSQLQRTRPVCRLRISLQHFCQKSRLICEKKLINESKYFPKLKIRQQVNKTKNTTENNAQLSPCKARHKNLLFIGEFMWQRHKVLHSFSDEVLLNFRRSLLNCWCCSLQNYEIYVLPCLTI